MPHRYTDVDRLILSRWTEVVGLREAFDALEGRMRAVIEAVLVKSAEQATARGFDSGFDAKLPTFWFWRPNWATKSSKEAGVYFLVSDFAPVEYGKSSAEHPETAFRIEDLSRLKVRDRAMFAQAVKKGVGNDVRAKWELDAGDLTECPLGLCHRDVQPLDRVNWMEDPSALLRFLAARLDEAQEIVPAVDKALAAVIR